MKISVLLIYLSNFFRTFEMTLIYSKIKIILTWCDSGVVTNTNENLEFEITGSKLYVPTVSLSTKNTK